MGNPVVHFEVIGPDGPKLPVSDVPGGPTIAMFADPAGNHVGLAKSDSM